MPSLLFVGKRCGQAREAIELYTSLLPDSTPGTFAPYGADQPPNREGTLMYADFQLAGQRFAAMDSASEHKFDFNEAVSFIIHCDDQEEVDHFWNGLSAERDSEQCGWLKDRFGVSWQVVPTQLHELMSDPDTATRERVMKAMLQMKKIDIAGLQKAALGA
jgi:predicted 3-demethylubiquinone-9 3-methyltransferase (glyoxalase superfamily)